VGGGSIEPQDILQGRIGDCYFLSAIAGLAEKDQRIKAIFPSLTINKNGIYMARILCKGVFQEVVVDDYFPVSKRGEQLMTANPSRG
jgi:calpain-15